MSVCTEQTRLVLTPTPAVHLARAECPSPVLAAVRRELDASPFAAIKELQCEFYEGALILRGNVPNFYTRQVAIALVMKIDGVEHLDDRVDVDRPAMPEQQLTSNADVGFQIAVRR